jgi:hypothetical protein
MDFLHRIHDTVRISYNRVNERVEAFTAVTMKYAVFYDVMPCGFLTTDVSEEHRLHRQGGMNQ